MDASLPTGKEMRPLNAKSMRAVYAPVGKTPVTFAVGGTRHKLSMIATVTNQGKTRWMIIDESFNSDRLTAGEQDESKPTRDVYSFNSQRLSI